VPYSELLNPNVRRRDFWAWASLDFANSGYTTVVLTAVFNAYFVSVVMADNPLATLAWTVILSVSYFLVMVTAPWLGAYADAYGAKRRLLLWATIACVVATAGLAAVGPGNWLLAAVLLVISNLAYASHQDLTAGYLQELSPASHLGRLSGYGWAWGYWGGLLALALSLIWIQAVAPAFAPGLADYFGLTLSASGGLPAQWLVGGAMVLVAILFAVVGFPALAVLSGHRGSAVAAGIGGDAGAAGAAMASEEWKGAWRRLWAGWSRLSPEQPLRRMLVCVVVYQAGVATVITLAAVYAQQVMGFDMAKTILLVLVVNITASMGAFLFGKFQDRVGHRNSLVISLLAWILMVLVAAVGETEAMFWVAANLAGLAMGASQSGARAAISVLGPADRQAEVFGYWGVAVHLASILGPLAYGLTTALTQNNHRMAIAVTGLFFVVGLVLLLRVPFTETKRPS
jgi:UMF1 family MFS transporter